MPNRHQTAPHYADIAPLPPQAGAGGGGGGSTLPATTSLGDVLTVIEAGQPTSPSSVAYLPLGGSAILSFTGVTATKDLGQSVASVTFAATANETPISATVAWSGVATGSQAVTPGTTMGGTITGPFVSSANGATLTVTLTCVFADGTKMASQAVTWAYRIVFLTTGDSAANVAAADAAYVEANYTNFQLHTGLAGSYVAAPTGTNVFPIATPTALGAPSWTTGGFPATPTFIQTIAGFMNPFGVVFSIDLYSFPNAANTYALS